MDDATGAPPLDGIRVLELNGIGPGPHACMVLADLGADVVTVLRPGEAANREFDSGHLMRRNRTVIELDLKSEQGREHFLRLSDKADVVVDVYRPGVAERLGIGPDDCLGRNERLVYGRVTGWGQEGPLAAMAGHDINYLSLTGHLNAIAREGQRPVPPLNLVADFGGGSMFLVVGILSALIERSASGRGQVVDAAIVDGTSTLGALIWALRAVGQWSDVAGTNLLDTGRPYYDVYACADGLFLAVGCLEPQFYAVFADVIGLGDDAPGQFDMDRADELRELIAERVATRSRDSWWEEFRGTDACVTPVLSYSEALDNAHLVARGVFVTDGASTMPAGAPRLSRSRTRPPTPAPEAITAADKVWT